jgi:hypothetical protein
VNCRLPKDSIIPAWLVKVAISASVIWSFVWANLGHPGALRLWENSPDGIMVLLGMGLGLSWVKDIAHRRMDQHNLKQEAAEAASEGGV